MPSNNNVSIKMFNGKLYMAFRTAPTHFAGKKTILYIVSSQDLGVTWKYEHQIFLKTDLREPELYTFGNQLTLMFFEAGSDPLKFTPVRTWSTQWLGPQTWSKLKLFSDFGEVVWNLMEHNGKLWMSSYSGNHYGTGKSNLEVSFRYSTDGENFKYDNETPVVYTGGVSEIGFEFNDQDNLVGFGRNEDGDDTGWGTLYFRANKNSLWNWKHPKDSESYRYDSPKMFKYKNHILAIARRNVHGRFDQHWRHLPFDLQKWLYLIKYSFQVKRTSIYYYHQKFNKLIWMADLPSAGDTAYPSIAQIAEDRFLIVNYSSPLKHSKWNWFRGQTALVGTGLYLTTLKIDKFDENFKDQDSFIEKQPNDLTSDF